MTAAFPLHPLHMPYCFAKLQIYIITKPIHSITGLGQNPSRSQFDKLILIQRRRLMEVDARRDLIYNFFFFFCNSFNAIYRWQLNVSFVPFPRPLCRKTKTERNMRKKPSLRGEKFRKKQPPTDTNTATEEGCARRQSHPSRNRLETERNFSHFLQGKKDGKT